MSIQHPPAPDSPKLGRRNNLEDVEETVATRGDMFQDCDERARRQSSSVSVSDCASSDNTQQQDLETVHPSGSLTIVQKWTTVSTACIVCFVVGINATGILAATEDISSEFNVSLEKFDYSFFLVTAWNTGAAVVPLFVLPLMEDFGIRPIFYTMYFLFVVFVMVQAVAPNFAILIFARVFAGSAGGVLQNCVDGIVADTWGTDLHHRALCLTIYIFALLGGVTIGPVVGGAVIKWLNWRW